MKRMLSLVVVAMASVLYACGGDQPTELEGGPTPPPPEPTVDEIAGKLRSAVGAIDQELTATGSLSPTTKEQALAQLRTAMNEFRGKKNMMDAQAAVASEVSAKLDVARSAADKDESQTPAPWTAVLGVAEVLQVLDPSSPKVERMRRQALQEINRPRIVKAPSFLEHEGTVTVFLSVLFPETGMTKDYQVREGEEFAEGMMRLKEVVGKNQGIRVSYTADGKDVSILKR